jgi:hypothetical protein
MYNTYQEVLQGLVDAVYEADQEKYDQAVHLIKVYELASEESKHFGYVGVGSITYAENALKLAQAVDFDETGNYGQNNGPVNLEPEH